MFARDNHFDGGIQSSLMNIHSASHRRRNYGEREQVTVNVIVEVQFVDQRWPRDGTFTFTRFASSHQQALVIRLDRPVTFETPEKIIA